MKTNFLSFLCVILLAMTTMLQCKSQTKPQSSIVNEPISNIWAKADSARSDNLPKSEENILQALIRTYSDSAYFSDRVYAHYRILKNKMRYGEPEDAIQYAAQLTSELPEENALYSLLYATTLLEYWSANRWHISRRTATDGGSSDVTTWTADDFSKEIPKLLTASVHKEMKEVPSDQVDRIIEVKQVTHLSQRPTLYDVMHAEIVSLLSRSDLILAMDNVAKDIPQDILFSERETFLSFCDQQSELPEIIQFFASWIRENSSNHTQEALAHADRSRIQVFLSMLQGQISKDEERKIWSDFIGTYPNTIGDYEAQLQLAYKYLYAANDSIEDSKNGWQMAYAQSNELLSSCENELLRGQAENIITQIESIELHLRMEDVQLPGRSHLVHIRTRNPQYVELQYYRISPAHTRLIERSIQGIPEEELRKQFTFVTKVPISLPNLDDYAERTYEVEGAKLTHGMYLVVGQMGPVRQWNIIQVSDLAVANVDQRNLFVMSRKRGNPVPHAEVNFEVRDYRRKENTVISRRSDEQGRISLDFTDKHLHYKVKIIKKEEDVYYDNLYIGHPHDKASSWRPSIHLLTDRSLYRPGQTIWLKGILYKKERDSDWRILSQEKLDINLRDANGKVVQEVEAKTNELGSFGLQFQIPSQILPGQFTIQTPYGSTSIRVEEYKRPTYKVDIAWDSTGAVSLGDSIKAIGAVRSYSDFPIQNAEVRYTIWRKDKYPFRAWWYHPHRRTSEIIQKGQLTTNQEGKWELSFEASAKEQAKYQYFEIQLTIADERGESITATRGIYLGRKKVIIRSEMEDVMNAAKLRDLSFTATNAFGKEVTIQTQIQIDRMDGPESGKINRYWQFPDEILMQEDRFRKIFPQFAFTNRQNPSSWNAQSTVWEEEREFAKQTILRRWVDNQPSKGYYRLQIQQDDEVLQTFYFQYVPESTSSTDEYQLALAHTRSEIESGATITEQVRFRNDSLPILQLFSFTSSYHWRLPTTWFEVETEAGKDYSSQLTLFAMRWNRVFTSHKTYRIQREPTDITIEVEEAPTEAVAGEKVKLRLKVDQPNTELALSVYDASLDAIYPHNWHAIHRRIPHYATHINYSSFRAVSFRQWRAERGIDVPFNPIFYPSLRIKPNYHMSVHPVMDRFAGESNMKSVQRSMLSSAPSDNDVAETPEMADGQGRSSRELPKLESTQEEQVRSNLQESAYWNAFVRSDNNGIIDLEIPMNDALTEWKILGFAHNKRVYSGTLAHSFSTKKDLMIEPHLPRFLRAGDTITITADIRNGSQSNQEVDVRLDIQHALDEKEVNRLFVEGSLERKVHLRSMESKQISWDLQIPNEAVVPMAKLTFSAKGNELFDAVSHVLRIEGNTVVLQKAIPFYVGGDSSLTIDLTPMSRNYQPHDIQPLYYQLDIVHNPQWYVLFALPYIKEQANENSITLINRLFANRLSARIVEEQPTFAAQLEQWLADDAGLGRLIENNKLSLKDVALTPWVGQAERQALQVQMLTNYLSPNQIAYEVEVILQKLNSYQNADGGFCWFPGGRSNFWTSLYVLEQMARMEHKGLVQSKAFRSLQSRGIAYIDKEMTLWFARHNNKQHIPGTTQLRYFLIRSLVADTKPPERVFEYLSDYYKNNGIDFTTDQQIMLALAWLYQEKPDLAFPLLQSAKEKAIIDPVLGAYWNRNGMGRSYQDPIALQAHAIECFLKAKDDHFAKALQQWLIGNKRTNDWGNELATVSAIHAVLLTAREQIKKDRTSIHIQPDINWDKGPFTSWKWTTSGEGDFPDIPQLTITNPNQSMIWGSASVSYRTPLDKVEEDGSAYIRLTKTYFKKVPQGSSYRLIPIHEKALQPGDMLVARLTLSVEQSLDFVHLQSQRPSSMEPPEQISGYKNVDGLYAYVARTDHSTDYYIEQLPKGKYVIEHEERVAFKGNCSGGLLTLECMYDPAFRAHTKGTKVNTQ